MMMISEFSVYMWPVGQFADNSGTLVIPFMWCLFIKQDNKQIGYMCPFQISIVNFAKKNHFDTLGQFDDIGSFGKALVSYGRIR